MLNDSWYVLNKMCVIPEVGERSQHLRAFSYSRPTCTSTVRKLQLLSKVAVATVCSAPKVTPSFADRRVRLYVPPCGSLSTLRPLLPHTNPPVHKT